MFLTLGWLQESFGLHGDWFWFMVEVVQYALQNDREFLTTRHCYCQSVYCFLSLCMQGKINKANRKIVAGKGGFVRGGGGEKGERAGHLPHP